ncbi:sensor histidine kinase [Enterobacter ludwigii]|uniref:sensor histidine kinase n=1 Tax=Enterobacter ludwigii TaxID=299767 RepID=UPI003BEF1870
MKKFTLSPRGEQSTLWNWICKRLISLAVGSIILIAFFMWVRFFVENKWHAYRMPEAVRAELSVLSKHPEQNINRYHEIIDTWYGLSYSDPTMGIKDWVILGILVLIFIPIIFMLTLKTARPISHHISRLAGAARSVAEGGFGTRVPVPDNLPLELRSLSENFNGMSMQLERYEKDLKKSHVIMAHELRSPLTAAIGRLQGIMDGVFEPSQAQLNMIMQQMNDLNRLVDDLHLLKLADANQLNLSLVSTSLDQIIREKVAWTMPSAQRVGVNIIYHEGESVTCRVDPYRIGQVFLILMDNALRYAAEGGILDIRYHVSDKKVSVIFRDNGPAVPDALLETIFSPFVREEQSRSRHTGGSGLGLSIARAICEAHRGTIFAERNASGGLSFTMTIPLSEKGQH